MKEAVLALAALALLTVSRPDAPVERPVPFRVGETLTYDVSWSTWLTAGKVVATVRDKRPSYSSTAYYIVAEGRPTPLVGKLYSLYYKMDTLLDASTLLSQRGSLYSEEGRRHRFRTTLFDQSARKATFEYRSSTTVRADLAVAPGVQDALAALYVLRTLPMHAGDRLTVPVSDDGTNYRVQLDVNAPERLTVPFGTVSAWRLKPTIVDERGTALGHNLTIWLGNDPRRLPVKVLGDLPVGSFVLSLRDAR